MLNIHSVSFSPLIESLQVFNANYEEWGWWRNCARTMGTFSEVKASLRCCTSRSSCWSSQHWCFAPYFHASKLWYSENSFRTRHDTWRELFITLFHHNVLSDDIVTQTSIRSGTLHIVWQLHRGLISDMNKAQNFSLNAWTRHYWSFSISWSTSNNSPNYPLFHVISSANPATGPRSHPT